MIGADGPLLEMGAAELTLLIIGSIFTLGLGVLFAIVFLRKEDRHPGDAPDDVD